MRLNLIYIYIYICVLMLFFSDIFDTVLYAVLVASGPSVVFQINNKEPVR